MQEIDQWIERLRFKKSASTIKQYQYHVERLLATAPDRQPSAWTTEQIIAYVGAEITRGVGEASIKQMVGAYRSFFQYLLPAASPAAGVPYPKVHRRKQRTLDAETALKVLASCDTSSVIGTRNVALLTLMLDTGLRSAEVCRIQLSKMNLEKKRLTVKVKGGDEEVAVYSRTTSAHLARWLAARSEIARPAVDALFVSIDRGYN